MIIRLQSSQGTKRIECDCYDTTSTLYYKVQQACDLDDIFGFKLYLDASKTKLILMHERKHLNDYDLKHGDMVYLKSEDNSSSVNGSADFSSMFKVFQQSKKSGGGKQHDDLEGVDSCLMKCDGLIKRKMDPNLCHHGPKAQCVHCAPIEPYDEEYMKQHNIKHMSFHSYIRKLQRGADKGKFVSLEDVSCKVKIGCKGHKPWPEGICTKCQPSAITLNRQVYRHVDNVTFENTTIVENFLNYWRITGNQRMGFLYGYYEPHKDVPLGIRAVVVAIYEPPQESTRDFILLHLDRFDFKDVDLVANSLGYKRIGWIFTDLIAQGKGLVKQTRNKDTHFLSADECIMAGFFQNCHPNSCQLSKSGYFGSKFVTVVVTGDSNNQVHTEAYQVSNQCMALVRDDCLLPCVIAPELAYVRESNKDRYVPDVFYKEKDEYGNDVTRIARPLPIEYLLVDVPVSASIEQKYTFNRLQQMKPFPIENRLIEGHLQDFHALLQYMNQFNNSTDKDKFLLAMNDFHLLIYLASMDTVTLRDAIVDLLEAIKENDSKKALEWRNKDQWSTVEQLMKAHDEYSQNSPTSTSTMSSLFDAQNNSSGSTTTRSDRTIITGSGSGSGPQKWSCTYCTFENETRNSSCEICNLPK